ALELKRDFEQRIVLAAYFTQNLMAGLLHDLRARIVMLIYPMPEAHQTEAVIRILGPADKFWNALGLADFSQHVQRRLVGAAMRGPPQARTPSRDAGEGIGAGRARKAHGRGRGVLLVVGVQDEYAIHRA